MERPRKHGAFPSDSHVIMVVTDANHDAEEWITQRVIVRKSDRGPGRIVFRADDPTLTPFAGLVISGELVRGLGLIERADAELATVRRAAAVKQRARGLSAGQLAVAIAEAQIAGAECFEDIEDLRADEAGRALRAVAGTPSAPTARQLAYRFRRSHIQALERAQADAGAQLDEKLDRDPSDAVTLDLDGSESVVYGYRKQGAARSRHGHLAYNSFVVCWAQRGRALTSELASGNRARITARESLSMLRRALGLLPEGHGQVTVRGDSGFYSAELMMGLRASRMRFSLSATRTSAIWRALADIPDCAWQEAIDMQGAEVAELPFTPDGWKHEPLRLIVRRVPVSAAELLAGNPRARRRKTIHPAQLQMVLDGDLASTYAYSFIVSDVPACEQDTCALERLHRLRAQIEERFKDAKLGQPLRHLPSGDLNANRLWLACSLMALTICAFICDLCPDAGASGSARKGAPLRRHAKALRRILFCVPGRIVRSGRRIVVRLAEGFKHFAVFAATYEAALALSLPGP